MATPQILVAADILDRLSLNVATSTALEQGDLISLESDAATLLNHADDDATFAGYALSNHLTDQSEPDMVVVGLRGIVTYDATSASYDASADLKYTSENCLVDAGGASTLCWVAKSTPSTATRVDALIDVLALGKLFVIAA